MAFIRERRKEAYLQGIPLIARGTADFLVNPTIEAGDVKVSTEGGEFVDITNLPQPVPAGSCSLEVYLTAEEMDAENAIKVLLVDQSVPKEWEDRLILIETRGHLDEADTLIKRIHNQVFHGRALKFKGIDPNNADASYNTVLPEGTTLHVKAKVIGGGEGGADLDVVICEINYSEGGNVTTPNPEAYEGDPFSADYLEIWVDNDDPLGTLTFQVSATHSPISVQLTADQPRGYLGDDGRLIEWPNETVGVVNRPRVATTVDDLAPIAKEGTLLARPTLAAIEGSALAKEGTVAALAAGVPCSGLSNQAKADTLAQVNAALDAPDGDEATTFPAVGPTTLRKRIKGLFQYFRNPRKTTAIAETSFQADGVTVAGTRPLVDDGAELTIGRMD